MKVLFLTSRSNDYMASCLWDGLQEVLGEENVVDAIGCDWLHKSELDVLCRDHGEAFPDLHHIPVLSAISGSREGRTWDDSEGNFDLLIAFSCVNRDLTDPSIASYRQLLRPGGKVAWVEAWDAAWQIVPPPFAVDAVFRKEISPRVVYPYDCHHLTFAMPRRLFLPHAESVPRPLDVFFAGNPDTCLPSHPVRWPMLSQVFRTKKTHRSVIASRGVGFHTYSGMLHQTKLALCPPGADDSDTLRVYEVAAYGAIPVFVGYPEYTRDHWFPSETCFRCVPETLPEHIDEALAHSLDDRRKALVTHAREYHTTAVRAKRLLEVVT
jgi:hypothetical protein